MTYPFAFHIIAYVLLCGVALTAAGTDVYNEKVPNKLTLPAMGVGLLLWTIAGLAGGGLTGMGSGFGHALLGLLAGAVPFSALVLMGGLHGGDMKLMAALGALSASWKVVLGATVYGLIVAAILAIVIMIRKRIVKRTLRRVLGMALMAATKTKADIPEDSPRVPFAVGVAVGALIAGAEQLLHFQTPWYWLAP